MADMVLEALRALVSTAAFSPDEAAHLLAESRVTADDVGQDIRPLWVLVADRIRSRLALDWPVLRAALSASPDLIKVAIDVLESRAPCGTTGEQLAMVRDSGIRTRFVDALRLAAKAAQSGASPAELERLAKDASAIPQAAGRVRNCKGDSLVLLERLEARWRGTVPAMLSTGFGELDEIVSLPNTLIGIGARAGVGKSAFVAGLVRNWLATGIRVGVLSYEDETIDLEARLISKMSGVPLRIAAGDVDGNPYQRQQIAEALERWSKIEHMLDTDDKVPTGSINDAIESIREMRRRGCAVAVLDNLTCVKMDGRQDRYDLVIESALSRLRGEAQSLQIPIIVIGHLRRAGNGADESCIPPKASDFSNSGAWENYTRLLLGMWRSDSNGGVAMRILKQNRGVANVDFDVLLASESAVVTGITRRATPEPAAPKEKGDKKNYSRER
jgi:hypothetical protein